MLPKKKIIKEYIIKSDNREIVCDLSLKKCKRLSISVSPDLKVKITAPLGASEAFIQKTVMEKTRWIFKSIDKFKKCVLLPSPEKYISGEKLTYLGDEYTLEVFEGKRQPVFISGEKLIVIVPRADNQSVKRAVDKWYRIQAEEIFENCLQEKFPLVSPYVNVEPTLKIRLMKRKWGSCSVSGKITLNLRLVQMPFKCIEFIVMHELCHLKHHNHSKNYYSFLNKFMPDWKERDKVLSGFWL